jgi:hypothetical protein
MSYSSKGWRPIFIALEAALPHLLTHTTQQDCPLDAKGLQRTVKSDCCPLDAQDLFHQIIEAEKTPRGFSIDDALKKISGYDKEKGGEGITLPDPSLAFKLFPRTPFKRTFEEPEHNIDSI